MAISLVAAELRRKTTNSLSAFVRHVTRHRFVDEPETQSKVYLSDFQRAYDEYCFEHSLEARVIEESKDILRERFLEVNHTDTEAIVASKRHFVFLYRRIYTQTNSLLAFLGEITVPADDRGDLDEPQYQDATRAQRLGHRCMDR